MEFTVMSVANVASGSRAGVESFENVQRENVLVRMVFVRMVFEHISLSRYVRYVAKLSTSFSLFQGQSSELLTSGSHTGVESFENVQRENFLVRMVFVRMVFEHISLSRYVQYVAKLSTSFSLFQGQSSEPLTNQNGVYSHERGQRGQWGRRDGPRLQHRQLRGGRLAEGREQRGHRHGHIQVKLTPEIK
jgi:hypothetical protein